MNDGGTISSTTCQIVEGDCRDVLTAMAFAGAQYDAVITDPPYGIGQWDWIRGPELEFHGTWGRAALDVLKPGGHALVFAGTRTFPYVAYALTEAGFELRDTFLWLYGSGMPKSSNIKDGEFEGWGTGVKPAWEPILCFRKPMSEKNTRTNLEKHGVGGFHIDATRVATTDNLDGGAYAKTAQERTGLLAEYGGTNAMRNGNAGEYVQPPGRWPANVVIDEVAAEAIDAQSGVLKSTGGKGAASGKPGGPYGNYQQAAGQNAGGLGDEGGASRFYYCAKVSRKERNAGLPDGTKNDHPTPKPVALMAWLTRLILPPGGHILDPFVGSGSTACAAATEGMHFTGIECDPKWLPIIERRVAHWRP